MKARTRTALEDSIDALRVDDLHVDFTSGGGLRRRRVLHAVNGVSFSVKHGETLGLVGESGCGKSTLVRTIFGLNDHTSGSVEILGHALHTLTPRRRRQIQNRVQLVFQDPYSSLNPRMTAHDIVAEPLRIVKRYSRERIVELFDAVGLGVDAFDRLPGQFSGGQRQRLGIARALALEPDVLVLDEPVSALDVSVQAQVINLLDDLQDRLGLSYLFIAHDLSVVRHISDRVAVMHLGKIVEIGTRDQIFADPQHPYTRSLLASVPVADPTVRDPRRAFPLRADLPDAANPPSGCAFRTRCPIAVAACAEAQPELAPAVPGGQAVACHRPHEARRQIPLPGRSHRPTDHSEPAVHLEPSETRNV